MNPDPFTLRELRYDACRQVSVAMTATNGVQINMNRKKGTKEVTPDALNPFIRRKSKRVMLSPADSMDVLKKVFCKK